MGFAAGLACTAFFVYRKNRVELTITPVTSGAATAGPDQLLMEYQEAKGRIGDSGPPPITLAGARVLTQLGYTSRMEMDAQGLLGRFLPDSQRWIELESTPTFPTTGTLKIKIGN